ncbi:alkanesulfonate monooxygenase SsuD/methylene tetrahydromethanopterin reductase-like flavin-dependent oxidoreductase (luciferase family) [Crossiella equi]|uniref:Alkanesulfonate monooxygenase SsuD/methylene tetrahydromethanopterin reductase-like flavin-dependent oxidoreductase (Luciferase family) n=1 Tax=Crossiella equi TaxID=130796 RepID=A0ABS5A468_9PSEU|nr:LLM class flavin-dependent oxidoreductase [Crossiella equi]MBP2471367.1 alkanesulfonate monooxygenase SsuD/methylene tetrahydromethanopterin reductase-like flavin-dependent oxidoreductase (luciferase family) [Crossiella equi]
MRFAIYVPCYGSYGDPALLGELAVLAEESGWDGFFVWDHLVATPPVADPWVTLGAVAVRTSRLVFGPMIVPLPRRRPWKLATEAATVQRLSGGRLRLGLGMGVPRDYALFGEEESASARAARFREGVELLGRFFAGEEVRHEGAHFRVDGVRFGAVEVPLWTSGLWPRRVPFLAAERVDGLFPIIRDEARGGFALPSPEQAAEIKASFVASGGRADADLAVWGSDRVPSAGAVSEYAEAGVTWLLWDGWRLSVAELRAVVAAGPPRGSDTSR